MKARLDHTVHSVWETKLAGQDFLSYHIISSYPIIVYHIISNQAYHWYHSYHFISSNHMIKSNHFTLLSIINYSIGIPKQEIQTKNQKQFNTVQLGMAFPLSLQRVSSLMKFDRTHHLLRDCELMSSLSESLWHAPLDLMMLTPFN